MKKENNMNKRMLELNRKLNRIDESQTLNEGIEWKKVWSDMKKSAQKMAPKVAKMIDGELDDSSLKSAIPIAKKVVGANNIGGSLNLGESVLIDEKINLGKLKDASKALSIATGFGTLAAKMDSILYSLDSNITSKLYEMTKFELFKLDSMTAAAKASQNEWWVKPMLAIFVVAALSYGIIFLVEKYKK